MRSLATLPTLPAASQPLTPAVAARTPARTSAAVRVTGLIVPALLLVLVAMLVSARSAYAASGDLAWQRNVTGPNNAASFSALSAAPKGGVFASGWVTNASGDFLATRYAAGGAQSWLRSLDFTLHAYDSVHAAASDRFGDLILAGQVDYPSATQSEAVVKYGPGGARLWTRSIKDTTAGQNTHVVADAAGNIYVETTVTTGGLILVKYSPSGVKRWVRTYRGSGDTQARAIAVDGAGNVYLAGFSYTPDYQVRHPGAQVWQQRSPRLGPRLEGRGQRRRPGLGARRHGQGRRLRGGLHDGDGDRRGCRRHQVPAERKLGLGPLVFESGRVRRRVQLDRAGGQR